MNYKTYIISFAVGPSMEMLALSAEQARILAQAERIQKGMNYKVIQVRERSF